MRRSLSSPLTFTWKFVVPILFIAGSLYIAALQGLDTFRNRDGTPLSYGEFALTLIFCTAISAGVVWFTKRFKRVEVDERALYVSNYWTEICVPLTEVGAVNESTGDRRYFSVAVDLRQASAFGQRIVFRPRFRLYGTGLHPVVLELRALCERARGEQGPPPVRPALETSDPN